MALRKSRDLFPGRKKGRRSGFLRVMVSVTPEQLAALQAEATRRMRARGSLKPDAGEVVREAIDAWRGRTHDGRSAG
jgi:hypothetical protein